MTKHIPVLADEVVDGLRLKAGQVVVDATMGGGGHSRLLAKKVGPDGLVIAVDRDPMATEIAETSLSGLPVKIFNANYCDVPEILVGQGIHQVDGILLDLGISSDQLADHQRGFSFDSSGQLDLRFNETRGEPAWKLINRLSEKHLADLIYEFGEERMSRRIARRIVTARREEPIRRADQLAALIRQVVPRSKNQRIDPATRTFQALRIGVNDELKWIQVAMQRLPERLAESGRIAVISFHSLEDRIVKRSFREDRRLRTVNSKPIRATEEETRRNSRSRSSRLRIAERIVE